MMNNESNKIRFKFCKLVRDKIPGLIRKNNIYVKEKEVCAEVLKDKVMEESKELIASKNNIELVEEIADIFEVLEGMMRFNNISYNEVKNKQLEKRDKRGNFDDLRYIEYIELSKNHPKFDFYSRKYNLYKP